MSEREVTWRIGRWESQEGWWRGQPGEKGVCRTHEHGVCVTPSAGNNIGAAGAKVLSVALAKCPNLRALDLSRAYWLRLGRARKNTGWLSFSRARSGQGRAREARETRTVLRGRMLFVCVCTCVYVCACIVYGRAMDVGKLG